MHVEEDHRDEDGCGSTDYRILSLVVKHTPADSTSGRLKQEDLEFKASRKYIQRSCFKTK